MCNYDLGVLLRLSAFDNAIQGESTGPPQKHSNISNPSFLRSLSGVLVLGQPGWEAYAMHFIALFAQVISNIHECLMIVFFLETTHPFHFKMTPSMLLGERFVFK